MIACCFHPTQCATGPLWGARRPFGPACELRSMQTQLTKLTLALLLLVAGCAEEPEGPKGPQLPPETQTGAGTLGFKIGDKIYVAKLVTCTQLEPGTFEVNSGSSVAEGWAMSFTIDSLTQAGTYLIDTLLRPGALQPGGGGNFVDNAKLCVYESGLGRYKGFAEVTRFDQINRIYSGRFRFIALGSSNCGEVDIREGRFDVKF